MNFGTVKEQLLAHFQKRVPLSAEEGEQLLAPFKQQFVKKRQMIIQPNFVATQRNYVLEGAFRAYVVCDQGQEHTIHLAIEDWWVSDYNSYILQQPASMFVAALEDSKILSISWEDEQRLKAQYHKYETLFRIMGERTAAHMQRRIISNLTQSATARYRDFVKKYPQMVQRVPQYALASYLGITTEYLSRLRNQKS